jgi:hypothetical protein
MPENGTIVVEDGKSTPEDHTFSPVSVKGDIASYANFDESFVDGRETLRLAQAMKARLREVILTTIVPRVLSESINGVTVDRVADFATFKTTCLLPKTWDEADIKDVRVMHANALNDAIVLAAVDRGEGVW